ncbi:MAG TPA: hypothetical protein VI636_18900 [Candidatus Angelobacter sp.]
MVNDDETRAFLRNAFEFLKSDYEMLSNLQAEIFALREALLQLGGDRFDEILRTKFEEAKKGQAVHEKIGFQGYDALIEKLKR